MTRVLRAQWAYCQSFTREQSDGLHASCPTIDTGGVISWNELCQLWCGVISKPKSTRSNTCWSSRGFWLWEWAAWL